MITETESATIREVVSLVDHERCLLFGSRARGDNKPQSDYDLLVVVGQTIPTREKIGLASRLRGEFADRGMDVDVIIKSEAEIAYYRDKPGHIVKHALAEGVPAW